MPNVDKPMLILVAGPYRSGTDDDATRIAANMRAMNEAALRLFRSGHIPITGEAITLPLVATAGSQQIGDAIFDEITHPLSRLLAMRCDAVLRIGGPSQGADEMVAIVQAQGRPVFYHLADIPGMTPAA